MNTDFEELLKAHQSAPGGAPLDKKHVELNDIDYEWVAQCTDGRQLKKAVKLLENEPYPDLLRAAKERLKTVDPKRAPFEATEASYADRVAAKNELAEWIQCQTEKEKQITRTAAGNNSKAQQIKDLAAGASDSKKENQVNGSNTPDMPTNTKLEYKDVAFMPPVRGSQSGALHNKAKSSSKQIQAALIKADEEQEEAEYIADLDPTLRSRVATREKEKGNECFKAHEYADAEAFYSRAIKYDCTNVQLYTNRAMASIKLKMWGKAEADCSTAIELDRSWSKAWMRRGVARAGQKNFIGAVGDLLEASCLEPTNAEIKKKIEEVEIELKKVDPFYKRGASKPNTTISATSTRTATTTAKAPTRGAHVKTRTVTKVVKKLVRKVEQRTVRKLVSQKIEKPPSAPSATVRKGGVTIEMVDDDEDAGEEEVLKDVVEEVERWEEEEVEEETEEEYENEATAAATANGTAEVAAAAKATGFKRMAIVDDGVDDDEDATAAAAAAEQGTSIDDSKMKRMTIVEDLEDDNNEGDADAEDAAAEEQARAEAQRKADAAAKKAPMPAVAAKPMKRMTIVEDDDDDDDNDGEEEEEEKHETARMEAAKSGVSFADENAAPASSSAASASSSGTVGSFKAELALVQEKAVESESLREQAEVYEMQGDFDLASQAFTKALQLLPQVNAASASAASSKAFPSISSLTSTVNAADADNADKVASTQLVPLNWRRHLNQWGASYAAVYAAGLGRCCGEVGSYREAVDYLTVAVALASYQQHTKAGLEEGYLNAPNVLAQTNALVARANTLDMLGETAAAFLDAERALSLILSLPSEAAARVSTEAKGLRDRLMNLVLEEAKTCKEQGNALFGAKDWAGAYGKYNRGLSTLSVSTALKRQDEVVQLLAQLRTNFAMACVHLRKFTEAEQACSAVLAVDPANFKALYRRGVARRGLCLYSAGLADMEAAARITNSKPLSAEIAELRKQVAAEDLLKQKQQEAVKQGGLGLGLGGASKVIVVQDVQPAAVEPSDKKVEIVQVGQTDATTAAAFLVSDKFAGARPGYYFRTDAQGTGYYLDVQAAAGPVSSAKALKLGEFKNSAATAKVTPAAAAADVAAGISPFASNGGPLKLAVPRTKASFETVWTYTRQDVSLLGRYLVAIEKDRLEHVFGAKSKATSLNSEHLESVILAVQALQVADAAVRDGSTSIVDLAVPEGFFANILTALSNHKGLKMAMRLVPSRTSKALLAVVEGMWPGKNEDDKRKELLTKFGL